MMPNSGPGNGTELSLFFLNRYCQLYELAHLADLTRTSANAEYQIILLLSAEIKPGFETTAQTVNNDYRDQLPGELERLCQIMDYGRL
jgi:hypothetical protein